MIQRTLGGGSLNTCLSMRLGSSGSSTASHVSISSFDAQLPNKRLKLAAPGFWEELRLCRSGLRASLSQRGAAGVGAAA